MKLWLIGGAGQVRLVLLPKWSKNREGKISGAIEMWGLNYEGNVTLFQTAVSFCSRLFIEGKYATLTHLDRVPRTNRRPSTPNNARANPWTNGFSG
jgi:hypothetical protein